MTQTTQPAGRKARTDPKELIGVLRHYAQKPEYQEIQILLHETLALIERRLIGPDPIDVGDVADILGESESWVREQVRNGTIPYHQAVEGGRVKFDRGEILDWWKSIPKAPRFAGEGAEKGAGHQERFSHRASIEPRPG